MSWIARLRRPQEAAQVAQPTEHETGYVKLMIMFGIPLTDPAEEQSTPPGMIVRGNWKRIVTLRPDEYGYPYGVIPRLILLWLARRARETESRVIDLGPTPRDFADELGLSHVSNSDLLWQAQRLFGASITLGDATLGRDAPMTVTLRVAEDFHFWDGQAGQVTLAEHLFRSVTEHPAPVDWAAVKGGRLPAMAIDVYAWLNLRSHYQPTTAPERIPWARLYELFGHQLSMDEFQAEFTAAIGYAADLVPEVAVGITPAGATLTKA